VIRKQSAGTFSSRIERDGDTLIARDVPISTEHRDRAGDIVRAAGGDFTDYHRNPIVQFGHGFTSAPNPVIGGNARLRLGTMPDGVPGVFADFEFSDRTELSRGVAGQWEDGHIRATSIGFMPSSAPGAFAFIAPDGEIVEPSEIRSGPGGPPPGWGTEFRAWAPTEFSVVPVPMNQEAVRRMLECEPIRRALVTVPAMPETATATAPDIEIVVSSTGTAANVLAPEFEPAPPVDLGAVARTLRDVTAEVCPVCERVAPYSRAKSVLLFHPGAGGDKCTGRTIERMAGPSVHDMIRDGASAIPESLISSGAIRLSLDDATDQARTRLEQVDRAVRELVAKEGRVLSAAMIGRLSAIADQLIASSSALTGVLDAARPASAGTDGKAAATPSRTDTALERLARETERARAVTVQE